MKISTYFSILTVLIFAAATARSDDNTPTNPMWNGRPVIPSSAELPPLTQLTPGLPGQLVQPLPGQIVPLLPGQIVGFLPDQLVPALPGQIVRSLPGGLVRPLPGQMALWPKHHPTFLAKTGK